MNIFSRHTLYPEGYKPVEQRPFDEEELSMIRSAKVVQSQWGLSVCFFMISGGRAYIPVSSECQDNVDVDDLVDPKKVEILTLRRESDGSTIDRVVL